MFSEAWSSGAGEYRQVEVDAFSPIGDLPPHHADVPGEMLVFGRELETIREPESAASAVETAIWAHMELVRIHPFQEGNGKTARLLMNVFVMRHVTSPKRPLDIRPELRERYLMCVQEYRDGRREPFQDFIADVLDDFARREQRRSELLTVLRRRRRRR